MNSPIGPASPYVAGVSDVRCGRFLDASVTYDGHNDQLGLGATAALIDSATSPGSANPADYAIGSKIKITAAGFVAADADRKSTRLNSSHSQISYAVFCLKKKK